MSGPYGLRFAHFLELERGWDGYDGEPIDRDVCEAARISIQGIVEGKASLVPDPEGGVQLAVHWQGFDMSVEFEPRKEAQPYGEISGFWERVR